MNKKRWLASGVSVALGMVSASVAHADGSYAGLSGGVSMVDLPSKSQFDQDFLQGIPAESSLDDSGEAWSVQIGYRWGRYVAAEIGYIDFGRADYEADLTGTTTRFSIRYLVGGPTLSAVGLLPLGERFDLYGRAGVLFADTRIRQRLEDLDTGEFISDEVKADSKDLLLGVGGTWNITESFLDAPGVSAILRRGRGR